MTRSRPCPPTTDRDRTRGFSLIELMVTMAILAILTALAVPAYAKLKARVYDATALSDVVNAGKALAGMDGTVAFTQTVKGPGKIPLLPGPYVSRGTTLVVTRTVGTKGSVTFLVQGSHDKGTGATFFFDSKGVYATGAKL